jgi:hypothetical protein
VTSPLRNVVRNATLFALAGAIVLGVGVAVDARRAAFAYLVAFAWVFGVSVGALGLLMIGHATGARWLWVLRRSCEAMALVVPLLAILFVPIALFAKTLYLWADDPSTWSERVRSVIHARGRWHSLPAFLARSAAYSIVLGGFALVLRRQSIATDRDRDRDRANVARVVGGGGMPIAGLVMTFAAWDWFMSIDPTWSSNIYGLYVFSGGFLGALSLLAIVAHLGRSRDVLPHVDAEIFHALGNLMLAMTIFWAWMAFSQLVVLWSTDIPDETSFYVVRWSGGWRAVSTFLIVGHFFVPLLLLLQRPFKRDGGTLAIIGAWILFAHWVDVQWLIVPVVRPSGAVAHWVDLGAMLFVVGVCTAFGAWRFAAVAPLPAATNETQPASDEELEPS